MAIKGCGCAARFLSVWAGLPRFPCWKIYFSRKLRESKCGPSYCQARYT